MYDLVMRLRGNYMVGEDGEFGMRDFSKFVPPICIEAAEKIEALEKEIDRLKEYEWMYKELSE